MWLVKLCHPVLLSLLMHSVHIIRYELLLVKSDGSGKFNEVPAQIDFPGEFGHAVLADGLDIAESDAGSQ